MSIEIIHRLEAMPWGPYKEVTTPSGPMRVKAMRPGPEFWQLWKAPKIQEIMMANGYVIRKEKRNGADAYIAYRWVKYLSEKQKDRLVGDSRAEDSDAPLLRPPGLEYRAFQRAGIKYAIDRLFGQHGHAKANAVLIGDDMGLGKQTAWHTPCLTPSGWRKVGDLRVGDEVIDADGMASKVTGVFPQGVKPIYEVEFSDGVKTNCGLEHLWEVRDANMATRGRGWTVITLGEMMKRGLKLKSGANKFEIPQFPGHLMTTGAQPKIDGWLLGQLIGNGSTGGPDCQIKIASNAIDTDVISRLEKHGGIETPSSSEGCAQRRFPLRSAGRLMDELRQLEVDCKSKEKSLHPSLLVAPWPYRVDLLQGLMDADGSNNKNRITYHTCAPQLAQDVAQLVRSLGGAAVVREYDRSAEGKPTEWQVNIHTKFCPFWSARKTKGWKADWRSRGNKIEAVRYLYDAEAVCIMVDHPRHLYVTEGYKLTHNTVQAIGIMNQDPDLRDIRALIVCPASLKLNWRNEMRKWILGGMGNEAFVVKDKWPGPLSPARFVIVNYDVLHKFEREIRSQAWDYVVMDEAHMIKNEKSRRTAYAIGGAFKMGEVHKIVEPIPTERRVFLTGTPVPNRIEEAWVIIKACDPEGLGANFAHFKKRYAKSNEHLGELQERMRTKFMVRRMKSQVLKELPPKQRQVMTLDPEEYGLDRLFKEEMTIFKEYKELLKGWQIQTELAKASGLNVYRELMKQKKLKLGIQAGMLAKLRKSTAIAKVPGVIDQVKIFCKENKKKVILFAHHIEVLDKLQEAAEEAGLKVVRIDGGTSTTARQQVVEDFQAGKADVFLGGIIPAGVGLTLTAADTVIFAELDWVPGQMTQCEDRAHRMGQTETVWAIHIVMEGSLDEYMAKRLIEKQEIIEKALDNMAPDEDLDEDGREDMQEGMMVDESAASKGVSPTKLAEESEKLTPSMREATLTALRKILKVENSVDQAILDSMREKQNLSGLEIALTRKIVYRYRRELEPMEAEMLAWTKKEKAA